MRMTRRLLSVCAVAALWAIPYAAIADDILLIHGHFYTGNPQAEWAAAVAVNGAHIAAVGDAVLSQDIFSGDPLTVGKTHVTMTIVGGKIVYRAQ